MKTKTTPSTVRLTPRATSALISLEVKHPGINRTIMVENALIEAAMLPEKTPITEEEFAQAALMYKSLCTEVTAYTTGPKKTMDGAAEKALAARVTAILLKRVFLEAKGRIVISQK